LVTEPEVVLDLFPGDCLEIALVKTEEGAQVGRIGGGRVGCQPSLDGQMLQKTVELFKRGTDKLNPGKWSRPDLAGPNWPAEIKKKNTFAPTTWTPPKRDLGEIKKTPVKKPGLCPINRDFSSD
jgi:hypothetical protein